MEKKNNLFTVFIILLIIVVIAIIIVKSNKNRNTPEPQPLTEEETELNMAIESDTTAGINSNLNSIDLNDTTDKELETVDQELQKL